MAKLWVLCNNINIIIKPTILTYLPSRSLLHQFVDTCKSGSAVAECWKSKSMELMKEKVIIIISSIKA